MGKMVPAVQLLGGQVFGGHGEIIESDSGRVGISCSLQRFFTPSYFRMRLWLS